MHLSKTVAIWAVTVMSTSIGSWLLWGPDTAKWIVLAWLVQTLTWYIVVTDVMREE